MTNGDVKWKMYERLAAKREEGFHNCSVILNHTVIGRRSGLARQVDVWLTGAVGGHEACVAIECRLYSRRVGIKDVEAFQSFLDDVAADRGVIISQSGFTNGAKARAEKIELETLTPEEAEDFDWEAYWEEEWEDEHRRFYACRDCGGNVSWAKDEGCGKAGYCRACGSFHVWCHRCNAVRSYDLSTTDKHTFHYVGCEGRNGPGRCRASWRLYFEDGLIEKITQS
jgi:hypothetical protein